MEKHCVEHVCILFPTQFVFLNVNVRVGHLSHFLAMQETQDALETVSLTLGTLQDGTSKLEADLSSVRAGLNNALNDPVCADMRSPAADVCRTIRGTLPRLEISANYSSV